MILTNCAACAAPLAHDAPRCVRCKLRGPANNLASSLLGLECFEEAKSLMRKMIPVAQRVLRDDQITVGMRVNYARAIYENSAATLNDVREALTTLEETERTVRRVFGGAHPLATTIGLDLRDARAALRARDTRSSHR